LQRIISNNQVGIPSITAALSGNTTFNDVFLRYSEALIYDDPVPSGVNSFNRTVTNTISGTPFRSHAFDIWKIRQYDGNKLLDNYGPWIWGRNQAAEIPPYSLTIHSDNEWENKTGSYTITLAKPSNNNVRFYLMVK
jgi:hypothetical protein